MLYENFVTQAGARLRSVLRIKFTGGGPLKILVNEAQCKVENKLILHEPQNIAHILTNSQLQKPFFSHIFDTFAVRAFQPLVILTRERPSNFRTLQIVPFAGVYLQRWQHNQPQGTLMMREEFGIQDYDAASILLNQTQRDD